VVFNWENQMNGEVQKPLWHDLSGRLSGAGHVLAVRVYFEDTDFSGLVYHTSYLRWCERGRSDYLRLLGIRHNELAAGAFAGEPCAFAVRRINAEFLKPARMDDIVEVHTCVGAATKASLLLKQEIVREGTPIFRLEAQCVLLSMAGRPLRLPAAIICLFPKAADPGL
jgi:acyl-CoA thioester hydrolase